MYQDKIIFIVGNSRSGTTMMLRVFNNHQKLMVLNELHFFEQLWSPEDKGKTISKDAATALAQKLLLIQRKGYNTGFDDYSFFLEEATDIIQNISNALTAEEVFYQFSKREIQLHHKEIICEKTPQNVFYIKEIFEIFPNARIINMVRDPRAVMLSQKNKWNRRKLGAWYITKKESLRLRINYHPITLSKLWNAAINAAKTHQHDKRVHTVIFEHLVAQPEIEIRKICKHLEIDFEPQMLDITQESSSIEPDSKEKGFKKERVANWKKGGLNKTEIWICEQITKKNMQAHHFELSNFKPNIFQLIYYILSFPIKLFLAFLMNLNRMKNIIETLKRRLK
jgi:hypothetical protein